MCQRLIQSSYCPRYDDTSRYWESSFQSSRLSIDIKSQTVQIISLAKLCSENIRRIKKNLSHGFIQFSQLPYKNIIQFCDEIDISIDFILGIIK